MSSKGTIRFSSRNTGPSEDNYYEMGMDFEGEEATPKSHSIWLDERILSRTSLLLLDYRRFKAARTIQAAFRGWYMRRIFLKKRAAAIKIQAAWRCFYGKRKYFLLLEATLQERIEAHFYRSAQIIQALWRGYWVRQTVHDQYRLKRMQMRAAEELLQCVAFKLHHLIRTRHIPGIYSLRNSSCLSRVEKLLGSLSFKQLNNRAYAIVAQKENRLRSGRKLFEKSAYGTQLPYEGMYHGNFPDSKCQEFLRETDADRKMYRILAMYEKAVRADPRVSQMQRKSKRFSRKKSLKPPEIDFCKDIIESMRKWSILSTNNISIDNNIFDNIQNVEKFLCEVQSLYSLMQGRCGCKVNLEAIEEKANAPKYVIKE